MLNKLLTQICSYGMLQPGDRLVCAVSGGADSMALLWAMYLLRDPLGIALEAAHFNHGLRGEESDRDEAFVRSFCEGYRIPCHVGRGAVVSDKKGLEAAAREARYGFLRSLGGKVATAHTADDNAETVLMHLVRGTGLKGLGGIKPVNGNVIRPMLTVTREEVLAFLREYHLDFVEDSSNGTDDFLRNRLRHRVMPLLKEENPRLSQNLSAMAMELRQDEEALQAQVEHGSVLQVSALRQMPPALRKRTLAAFLQHWGVKEPERSHIALAEKLVFSHRPSAVAEFPQNVQLRRCYDTLMGVDPECPFAPRELEVPGTVVIGELGLRITAAETAEPKGEKDCFAVVPRGKIQIRRREAGDSIRLPGGTKTLKKLYIDRKIPEHKRLQIPVVADEAGVLGVYGVGPNRDRLLTEGTGVEIRFETL